MPACEISPEALADMEGISTFIAADDPDAADRIIEEFFAAFDQLAAWPRSGHVRPDLAERQVRFWPVRSYLVVYRELANGIQIAAILHASRDIPRCSKIDEDLYHSNLETSLHAN
jgi:plasmid stabilization system protein ParE